MLIVRSNSASLASSPKTASSAKQKVKGPLGLRLSPAPRNYQQKPQKVVAGGWPCADNANRRRDYGRKHDNNNPEDNNANKNEMLALEANYSALLSSKDAATAAAAAGILNTKETALNGEIIAPSIIEFAEAHERWCLRRAEFSKLQAQEKLVDAARTYKRVSQLRLELASLQLFAACGEHFDFMQRKRNNSPPPVFTVEGQLSEQLIRDVPNFAGFHVMHFKSCGYQAEQRRAIFDACAQQRAIKLAVDEQQPLGCVHLTVSCHESGGLLHEVLGVGKLDLQLVYESALLEQCLHVPIVRRGATLGTIALKVSMLVDSDSDKKDGDSNQATSPSNNNNNNNNAGVQQAVPTQQQEAKVQADENANPDVQIVEPKPCESPIEYLHGLLVLENLVDLKNDVVFHKFKFKAFWKNNELIEVSCVNNNINYTEEFTVANDKRFHEQVNQGYLSLESQPTKTTALLPLSCFYTAFSNKIVHKRISENLLPTNRHADMAELRTENGSVGKLKYQLVMGTRAQIDFHKATKMVPHTAVPTPDEGVWLSNFFIMRGSVVQKPPASKNMQKSQRRIQPNVYVRVKLPSTAVKFHQAPEEHAMCTKTAQKSTNPVWREMLQLEINTAELNVNTAMQFELWHQRGGAQERRNDWFIGEGSLKLGDRLPIGIYGTAIFKHELRTGWIDMRFDVDRQLPQLSSDSQEFHNSLQSHFSQLEAISDNLRARLGAVVGTNITGACEPAADLNRLLQYMHCADDENGNGDDDDGGDDDAADFDEPPSTSDN